MQEQHHAAKKKEKNEQYMEIEKRRAALAFAYAATVLFRRSDGIGNLISTFWTTFIRVNKWVYVENGR